MEYIERVPSGIIKLVIGVSLGLIGLSGSFYVPNFSKSVWDVVLRIQIFGRHGFTLSNVSLIQITNRLLCTLSILQEYMPGLIEGYVNMYIPFFQTYAGRGIIYIIIASFAFPNSFGLLSQAGALVILAAGIIYIVFSAKLEERDRSGAPSVSFPSNILHRTDQHPEDKVSPYQPPTAHV